MTKQGLPTLSLLGLCSFIILSTVLAKEADAFSFTQNGENTYQVLELPVNSTPVTFVVDTGSLYSILDEAIAPQLNLIDTGSTISLPSYSVSGPLSSGSIFIGGSVPDTPIDFVVSDFPLELGASGVLGQDFFTQNNFSLNGSLFSINPDFPVEFVADRLLVTLKVKGMSGEKDVKFLIDTGSPVTIITKADSDTAGLAPIYGKDGKPVTVTLEGGAAGVSPINVGILDSLGVRPFVINDIQGLPPGASGLLGMDILDRRFTLTDKILTLKLPTPPNPPDSKETVPVKFITVTRDIPGPLPLLGVGAAFGFSRKLRKRIQNSRLPEVMSAIG